MVNIRDIKVAILFDGAVKTGFAVAFVSMTSAALINLMFWLAVGAGGAPGRAGFFLAFGVSAIAGLVSGLISLRRIRMIERAEAHAEAIAQGNLEATFANANEPASPLQHNLKLIAEAQLKRVEEFHRLLEDSRIREERLYEALDTMDDEIAVFDEIGMLVCVNKAYSKFCNASGAPVAPGMLRREILKAMAEAPGNGVPATERDMWLDHQFQMRELAASGGKPVDSLQRDGRHLRFTMIATPLKNQIEITTDITEAVNDHMDVERSRREVDAAEEIKKATVARFAQTIRAPMTGVLAAAAQLSDMELTDAQQDKLDIIRRSSSNLLGIMQDMMQTSGPVTDAAPKPSEARHAPEAPNPPEAPYLSEAPMRPISLAQAKPRRAVLLVRSEELAGRLFNLLAQDSVQTVSVETIDLVLSLLSQDDEELVPVDFVMTDDAAALEELRQWSSSVLPVNRPKIIDLNHVMKEGFFPQAEAEPAPAPVIVESAEIILTPEAEKPRTVIELPKRPAPRVLPPLADLPEEGAAPVKNARKLPIEVLIVEDNDVNQIVYDQIMSNCGYHYLIVSSGEEGVNTAVRETPRLILMDISMPGLNGLEATKRIRAQLNGRKRPVIVGMTSHLLSGDKEKCLTAGMDDYSLKPSTVGPLRAQIASWLGAGAREAAAG
jgi:CheY-like chemotaxis protein/PAS domain-containing protein